MDRSLRWRSIGLLALLVFCVLTLLPSLVGHKALPSWYGKVFERKIQLGLDLQGGLHIVYSIDLDKAVDDKASEIKRDTESHLLAEGIKGEVTTPSSDGGPVTIKIEEADKREGVKKWLYSSYDGIVVDRTCSPRDPEGAICVRVSSDYSDGIKAAALSQAVETIRSRIDEDGVSEPTVITKGDDIIVELPGLDDKNIARIKDIIARTAKLEFKIVEQDAPFMRELFKQVRSDAEATKLEIKADVDGWRADETGENYDDYYLFAHDREEWIPLADAKDSGCLKDDSQIEGDQVYCKVLGRKVIDRYVASLAATDPKFVIPDGRILAYEKVTPPDDAEDDREFWRSYYLDDAVLLTGSAVTNAITIWDPQTNRPEVLVEFNRYGTRAFGDMTSKNVGRKMAIILDDKVASAPVIQSAITGGRSNISMGGGNAEEQQREADILVAVLKTGSLPAPLRMESEAKLGPTLGQDAIAKTQLSFILGTVLVLIMMIWVYRFAGLLSIAALAVNILIMLTAMAMFGATLTLPGIAALVLTVGMAVDGNILVYERIRDELHGGKSVRGAVEIGFARAFTTVLDGHLTTAAAGWVLLQYGSGPIQGFATMLLVGIGTTLFTTVWVTRVFFDLLLAKNKNAETISI